MASTLTIVYSLTDTYFVSRLGTAQVGAISVAFPLYNFFGILGILTGTGAASWISRYIGAGRRFQALTVRNAGLHWYLIMSIPVIAAGYFLSSVLLPLFGGTETILPFAETYMRIMIPASLIGGVNIYFGSVLRGEGYPGIALAGLLLGTGVNIAADPLFIFILNRGIAGAAWASLLGQFVSLLIYAVFLPGRFSRSRQWESAAGTANAPARSVRPGLTGTGKRIIAAGAPVAAGQVFVGVLFALIQFYAKRFGGTESVAAAGIVLRIYTAALFLVLGFIRGVQPLAGMLWGMEDRLQLVQLLRRSSLILFFITGVISAAALLFPSPILSLFSSDPRVITEGTLFLRLGVAGFFLFAFQLFAAGVFQAIGDIRKTFFLLFARNLFLLLPGIAVLPLIFGMNWIFYSFVIADVISAVFLFAYLRRHRYNNTLWMRQPEM